MRMPYRAKLIHSSCSQQGAHRFCTFACHGVKARYFLSNSQRDPAYLEKWRNSSFIRRQTLKANSLFTSDAPSFLLLSILNGLRCLFPHEADFITATPSRWFNKNLQRIHHLFRGTTEDWKGMSLFKQIALLLWGKKQLRMWCLSLLLT